MHSEDDGLLVAVARVLQPLQLHPTFCERAASPGRRSQTYGSVVEPRFARHRVFRLEAIRHRRIIYNDGLVQVPAYAAQILDVAAVMEHAVLAEETVPAHAVRVEQIGDGVCIFGQTRCEKHHFVQLAHSSEKLIHKRPFQHVDVVCVAIDFNRNDVVRVGHRLFTAHPKQTRAVWLAAQPRPGHRRPLLGTQPSATSYTSATHGAGTLRTARSACIPAQKWYLERAVHERFIQIQNQAFPPCKVWRLGW